MALLKKTHDEENTDSPAIHINWYVRIFYAWLLVSFITWVFIPSVLDILRITPGIWNDILGEQVGMNIFALFIVAVFHSYPYVFYAFTIKIIFIRKKKSLSKAKEWSIFGGIIGISLPIIVVWSYWFYDIYSYEIIPYDAGQGIGILSATILPIIYFFEALTGMVVGYVIAKVIR